MASPFSSALGKIARAGKHLDALDCEIRAVLESKPYSLSRGEFDPTTGDEIIRIKVGQPLPDEWSDVLGDFASNLRKALDHLVYELAGKPERGKTAFPIFRVATEYFGEREKYLAGVGKGARTVIDNYQPYHRSNPDDDPLAIIAWLDNADKHRDVHAAFALQDSAGIFIPEDRSKSLGTMQFSVTGYGVPLEDGAEVMRIHWPKSTPEMKVDPTMAPEIAFGERQLGFDDMRRIQGYAKQIVERLARV
jgi:hypothetical protein